MELAAAGHHVEVFSGQPYPELDDGPRLRQVPSLDLYRDEDPFRTPGRGEIGDWADALETVMLIKQAKDKGLNLGAAIEAARRFRETNPRVAAQN